VIHSCRRQIKSIARTTTIYGVNVERDDNVGLLITSLLQYCTSYARATEADG
jgi:hypothetical protein